MDEVVEEGVRLGRGMEAASTQCKEMRGRKNAPHRGRMLGRGLATARALTPVVAQYTIPYTILYSYSSHLVAAGALK